MRILYFSSSPVPSQAANSVQVVKMCAAFVRAGHEVRLFCRQNGPAAPDRATLQRVYGITEAIALTTLTQPRLRLLGRALYARRAARHAQAHVSKADLVYGRDIYSLLRARRWGLPIVYEAHMPPANRVKRRMHHLLFSHPSFRRLVTVSHRLAEYYRSTFPELRAAEILAAPNGADDPRDAATSPDAAASANRLQSSHPDLHRRLRSVGYVGSPAAHKGIELVIDLARALPELDFHLVGGSEQTLADLRRSAPANLRLHGHLSQDRLNEIYPSFKVVLAPYRRAPGPRLTDDTEWGSPLKIFEYMAHGCCIVASDLPVIRELVGDGEAAVLCPPEDLEAWRHALGALLNDPDRRRLLAEVARRRFAERYTRSARAQTVLAGLTPHSD